MKNSVVKTGKKNNEDVNFIIRKISAESPELKDLNREQLEQIAKIVITQRLANEMNEQVNIAGIDYRNEVNLFIKNAGKSKSYDTKLNYRRALAKLNTYTRKNNINIFLMNYAQADEFIYSLSGSPNSIRLTIAAVSSFYSFLERRYSVINNPIRGTKARPEGKTVKELEIPVDNEIPVIIDNLPPLEKMAVYIMANRGLRIGALTKLKIWGNSYTSISKGKNIHGEFSEDIMDTVRENSLNNKFPFAEISTNALKLRIYRATLKMKENGLIKSAYSAHDFRHYFAVSEYKKDKDIYKLSKLLDHSNISITQSYLRSFNID